MSSYEKTGMLGIALEDVKKGDTFELFMDDKGYLVIKQYKIDKEKVVKVMEKMFSSYKVFENGE